jgi:hypothetical protein
MTLLAAVVLAAGLAQAQPAPSDFDFMAGRWTGRETCSSGLFDVIFDAQRCVSTEAGFCESAYRGKVQTTARTPGARGGTGAGTGQPTADPSALAIEMQLPFGTLTGGARFWKAKQRGQFASTGLKMGGVVMQLPYGVKGSFQLTQKGKQLGYLADIVGPDGRDHCGGTLKKAKTATIAVTPP